MPGPTTVLAITGAPVEDMTKPLPQAIEAKSCRESARVYEVSYTKLLSMAGVFTLGYAAGKRSLGVAAFGLLLWILPLAIEMRCVNCERRGGY